MNPLSSDGNSAGVGFNGAAVSASLGGGWNRTGLDGIGRSATGTETPGARVATDPAHASTAIATAAATPTAVSLVIETL
jgi:hypothetical protein